MNGFGIYNNGSEVNNSIMSDSDDVIKIFSPTMDLYLWKRTDDNDEFTVNSVVTFYDINRNNLKEEKEICTDNTFYKDERELKNFKKSFIGEFVYNKNLTNLKWNSGYRIEYSSLHSEAVNRFGINDFESNFFSQNIYTELDGFYKQWIYRVSLGLNHIKNNANTIKLERVYFAPQIILGYNISKNQSFRFMFDRTIIPCDLNNLSNSISDISVDILCTGNPDLKNEIQNKVIAIYNFNSKYIDLSLTGIYMHTNNYIIDYFKLIDNKYWALKENGTWRKDYGVAFAANIKPLGNNILQTNILLLPCKTNLKSKWLNWTDFIWENQFGLNLNFDPIAVSYQYSIPVYRLQGSYRTLSENRHHLNLKYRFGNWRVTAGILYMGKSAHYATDTLMDSLVKYKSDTHIFDNKNMITLGLTYHLNQGKNKSYSKKLTNKDTVVPIR